VLEADAFPDVTGCTENSGTLGDCNADGDLDFVGTDFSGMIWVVMNNGTPQSPYWDLGGGIPGIGFGDSSGKLALADLDGDGDLDIV
jgi:hypothetical protein